VRRALVLLAAVATALAATAGTAAPASTTYAFGARAETPIVSL